LKHASAKYRTTARTEAAQQICYSYFDLAALALDAGDADGTERYAS
jgi:hypothetical protein